MNELYILVGKDKYEAHYSTDPCQTSATVERVFVIGPDTKTGERARIEINSSAIKEMLEVHINRYLEIGREGDGANIS